MDYRPGICSQYRKANMKEIPDSISLKRHLCRTRHQCHQCMSGKDLRDFHSRSRNKLRHIEEIMSKKAAVFDMDGTILNTLEDLKDTLNYALQQAGYEPHTLEEVRSYVGNGIRRMIECAVPEGTAAGECDRIQEIFMPYYQQHCADQTCAYPGVRELLERFRAEGILTAVVSNKADGAVQDLVEVYFKGLFDIAVGEQAGIRKKPAPDMVEKALDALGVKKEEAVYIGDSEVDMATAENAGLDRIIVAWGFRDKEFLKEKGAERIAENVQDVYSYFQGL